ncbi:MAG TPA: AAA family ATPase [Pyrinomonadaceae bacterium]|nr:AAA family ATPase [Pyrinomonadaceae bacterium]
MKNTHNITTPSSSRFPPSSGHGIPQNNQHTPFLTGRELLNFREEPRDEIIHGLSRGDIGILVASTNVGKSTLLRNLLVNLSIGRRFEPLVVSNRPRKVALIDFEDSTGVLHSDFRKMASQLTESERTTFEKNFTSTSYPTNELGTRISLTKADDIAFIIERLRKFQPDVVIIETISTAFEITNENDNSEVVNRVMKPLGELARKLNSAVIVSHHVGKSRLEGGLSRESTHRGRGASAFADQSKVIWSLAKYSTPNTVNLSCAKTKGPEFKDTILRLDPINRTFTTSQSQPSLSSYDVVLSTFNDSPIQTIDGITQLLSGKLSKSTVVRQLEKALEAGDVEKSGHGKYNVVKH